MDKQNNNDWYGATLQTDGTPMVDAATGRPLFLRTFEFAMKPLPEGTAHPTKQQLFNAHWAHIRTLIWSDGLVANTDVDPRVVIGKKRYRIFVLCEPRFRQVVIDRPTTLQAVFKNKVDKKK